MIVKMILEFPACSPLWYLSMFFDQLSIKFFKIKEKIDQSVHTGLVIKLDESLLG